MDNLIILVLKLRFFLPDNNASERAFRNFKIKLKISNFFKSTAGSETYAVIRSVIDTAIKTIKTLTKPLV